jgi:hypothetical protein
MSTTQGSRLLYGAARPMRVASVYPPSRESVHIPPTPTLLNPLAAVFAQV